MIEGVLAENIDGVWGVVSTMLQKAVDRSQRDYTVEDIYGLLLTRDMQLWIWKEIDGIKACAVTQILNYPRRRVCQIPFVAGSKLRYWIGYEEVLRAWAKERNCSQLEGFCRDGWLRILKNWKKAWVTMRRDI